MGYVRRKSSWSLDKSFTGKTYGYMAIVLMNSFLVLWTKGVISGQMVVFQTSSYKSHVTSDFPQKALFG